MVAARYDVMSVPMSVCLAIFFLARATSIHFAIRARRSQMKNEVSLCRRYDFTQWNIIYQLIHSILSQRLFKKMAIGPFARIIAQVIVPLVAVLARALPAAYQQALQNARKAGMDANTASAASSILRRTISKQEALQVLNLSETEVTLEAVQKVSPIFRGCFGTLLYVVSQCFVRFHGHQ